MDITSWRIRSKRLKSEIHALYLASKDPRTPWYAKAFAALILGYVLSPIDLVPDFIPVFGFLDDLVIVPAGIVLLMKMIPREVMAECREKVRSQTPSKKPRNWIAAAFIVIIWMLAIYGSLKFLWGIMNPREE
jgi:uncharacterized membrane protein YkvA (DUF1232 family)